MEHHRSGVLSEVLLDHDDHVVGGVGLEIVGLETVGAWIAALLGRES